MRKSEAIGFFVLFALFGMTGFVCSAADIYVPGDYLKIQDAVNAAVNGDTIWVADGVYSGPGNSGITLQGKAISVRSVNGADYCVIDCNGNSRAFLIINGESNTTVVRGFTILNGYGDYGGAFRISSSPRIVNCRVLHCVSTGSGGAFYFEGNQTYPVIQNVLMMHNYAYDHGGAINCSVSRDPRNGNQRATGPSLDLRDSTIVANSCQYNGGGAYLDGATLTADQCLFYSNSANDLGGAVSLNGDTACTLDRSVIAGNTATMGAGLYLRGISNLQATNLVITGNVAGQNGGACAIADDAVASLMNCSVSANRSYSEGALHLNGFTTLTLTNTIVSDNANYGVYKNSSDAGCFLRYNLFSANESGDYYDNVTGSVTGAANMNLFVPNATNTKDGPPMYFHSPGGVWTDHAEYDPAEHTTRLTNTSAAYIPGELEGKLINTDTTQFQIAWIVANTETTIDVAGDYSPIASSGDTYSFMDFHIQNGSAALDRGWEESAPSVDIDGESRPGNDSLFDIGADEAPGEYLPADDVTPPISFIVDLPDESFEPSIVIPYLASDGESGVEFIELFYRWFDGPWSYFTTVNMGETLMFDSDLAAGDGRYDLYTIGVDFAGNYESPPDEPDASILVMTAFSGQRIYVDVNATGNETGENWTHALTSLETGVRAAAAFDVSEIWVGDGTYPAAVTLHSGLSLLGGFEGSESTPADRDIDAYPSIIDGSTARDGEPAYHVVQMIDVTHCHLNGFYITGGYASSTDLDRNGGGVFCVDCDETNSITLCRIHGNNALQYGGGLCMLQSEPDVTDCIMFDNSSSYFGGGVFSSYSTTIGATRRGPLANDHRASQPGPNLTGCVIAGNHAPSGGGIANEYLGIDIDRCVIAGNIATSNGGGIYISASTFDRLDGTVPPETPPAGTRDVFPTLINTIVTGNAANNGGGLYLNSDSIDTRHCIISRNHAATSLGGGITFSANGTISNTIITENSGYSVYQVACGDVPNVLNCLIEDNENADYFLSQPATLCIGADDINLYIPCAAANRSGDPLFIQLTDGQWSDPPVFDPNTGTTLLTDQTAAWSPGVFKWETIQGNIDENREYLIVDNTETTMTVSGNATSFIAVNDTYRLIDHHIQNGSAALDRGDPVQDVIEDFDRDPRPGDDGLFDIGADEAPAAWQPPVDTTPPTSRIDTLPILCTLPIIDLDYTASDSESGLHYVRLYYNRENTDWVQYGDSFTSSPIAFDTAETGGDGYYEYKLIATDNAGNVEPDTGERDTRTWVICTSPYPRIHVNIAGTGPQTGAQWNTGLHDLAPVAELATHYSVYDVWVAQGTYPTSISFVTNLHMFGGFAGTETALDERELGLYESILDGAGALGDESAIHVVVLTNVSYCHLDGFTITGGEALGQGADGCGGGIWMNNVNDTVTIMNCDIISNRSIKGGGLYSYNTAAHVENCRFLLNEAGERGGGVFINSLYEAAMQTLYNCVIGGNTAEYGAGICLQGVTDDALAGSVREHNAALAGSVRGPASRDVRASGTVADVANCMITENVAAQAGGGIYSAAEPLIRQCTIADNWSPTGSGLFSDGEAIGSNCIIWGNSSDSIMYINQIPDFTYSNIEGGFSGSGNINADPLFTEGLCGYYYLSDMEAGQSVTSPCKNAGSGPGSTCCISMRYGRVCMDTLTTRSDDILDSSTCDMGFHFHPLNYTPPTPTIPPPTPTPSPHFSPTPRPTNTPMSTYTPSPIPTSTPTRRPTYTPTLTPTQGPSGTPTPDCRNLGVTIEMPSGNYHAGDTCYCTVHVCNPTGSPLVDYPLFVILEVYGALFFAPSFNETFDSYLEMYPVFPDGRTGVTVLPEFSWPDMTGSASDIHWLAALTDPEITGVAGKMDTFTFGWNQ
ncbi:hypothetical protein JXA80_11385 [bacterium]|nr:hypothetical protein [candidate division CSSED10-310 bacterium]